MHGPMNVKFNPLKPELNPICYLLALLGAHHFLHVSRIRVKLLNLRLLMSYIYIYDISSLRVKHKPTDKAVHSRHPQPGFSHDLQSLPPARVLP